MGESIALQPRASRKLLHNPGTGWVMYIDHFDGDPFPEAEAFWRELEPVIPYISILYLRVSWSDMEPSPGRYAWIYDENFKALTHQALARGIRLAFRIFTDGQNASAQATPEFVREAGALGYEINPGNGVRQTFWTPVVTDPVFRRCLESFVLAFGAYYDRPAYVDYVDAGGLGWWGEMHNMDYLTPAEKEDTFDWITGLYQRAFHHVLLGVQYGCAFSMAQQDALLDRGWVIRRDSFGSPQWFDEGERAVLRARWPRNPVFAENCYHHLVTRAGWWQGDGFATLRDCLTAVLDHARDCHANTLDLRVTQDALAWVRECPDLVEAFGEEGGYRLRPASVRYVRETDTIFTETSWVNDGWGRLPADNPFWREKYRPAYALLREDGSVAAQWVQRWIAPSGWVKGETYTYQSRLSLQGMAPGTYTLGLALVDTEAGCVPGIALAVEDAGPDGWLPVGRVDVDSQPG